MNVVSFLGKTIKAKILNENKEIFAEDIKNLNYLICDSNNSEISENVANKHIVNYYYEFKRRELNASQKALRVVNELYWFDNKYPDWEISAKGIFYLSQLLINQRICVREFRFLEKFRDKLFKELEQSEYSKIVLVAKDLKMNKDFQAHRLLHITDFLYSTRTNKEVFKITVIDWQDEYFKALFKKQIWKAR